MGYFAGTLNVLFYIPIYSNFYAETNCGIHLFVEHDQWPRLSRPNGGVRGGAGGRPLLRRPQQRLLHHHHVSNFSNFFLQIPNAVDK